jgi:hypothetical protein
VLAEPTASIGALGFAFRPAPVGTTPLRSARLHTLDAALGMRADDAILDASLRIPETSDRRSAPSPSATPASNQRDLRDFLPSRADEMVTPALPRSTSRDGSCRPPYHTEGTAAPLRLSGARRGPPVGGRRRGRHGPLLLRGLGARFALVLIRIADQMTEYGVAEAGFERNNPATQMLAESWTSAAGMT